jgi:cytochrome P450
LPAFRRDRLGFLARMAAEHGDIARWRVGPYRVWQLSHPEWVGEVLVTHADRFRKGPVLRRARAVLGDGLLTAEGEPHRRHRRLVQAAFQRRRVAGYAATMTTRAVAMADRWHPAQPVDVHAEAVRATLGVAGETLLGTNVDADVDAIEAAIADLLSAYRLAFAPFGWRLHRLPVGPARRLRRARAVLDGLVDRMLAQRRAAPGSDLLSALIESDTAAQAGETGLSAAEIRNEAVTLLLAGHETTANALAFACHLMAAHPEVAARVHAEVDTVLADRDPGFEDCARLPVTRGVLGEALRLFPPSWAIARQAVAPWETGGHRIEPGDVVVLPPWVIHRDGRWWRQPQRCEPDRWAGETAAGHPRRAFFAFGAGARQCLGEGFAWTEGTLALAVIARRWHLEAVAGAPVRLDPLITLRPRHGVWVRPRARCHP